ncbi:MAG: hypothetical protein FJ022_06340 [Chloroflexi bacterium]|nr:hypothetical protein [Chloroflexota bacterium]
MAVQPFTQAIWGRPRIKVGFHGKVEAIQCSLQNCPITNSLLRKIGVTRSPVQDLSVTYYITETNMKVPLASITPQLTYSGYTSEHISLPATTLDSAVFNITPEIPETFFDGQHRKTLASGVYTVYIRVEYDTKVLVIEKDIEIRKLHEKTYIMLLDKTYAM